MDVVLSSPFVFLTPPKAKLSFWIFILNGWLRRCRWARSYSTPICRVLSAFLAFDAFSKSVTSLLQRRIYLRSDVGFMALLQAIKNSILSKEKKETLNSTSSCIVKMTFCDLCPGGLWKHNGPNVCGLTLPLRLKFSLSLSSFSFFLCRFEYYYQNMRYNINLIISLMAFDMSCFLLPASSRNISFFVRGFQMRIMSLGI